MKIQFIRHATLILYFHHKKILVDPVLSLKGTMPPIENVPNHNSNPLVELSIPVESVIDCDAVILTHTHKDHFDDLAAKLLVKNIPVFCQPEDEKKLKQLGFMNVIQVIGSLSWEGVKIDRTEGKHGHGMIAVKMSPVSGFIISAPDEPIVYLMGDTVWCRQTKKAFLKYAPDIAISNCGSAQFHIGKAITMNAQDILSVCNKFPDVKVVAVHMEAWNHCRLSRKTLRDFTVNHHIDQRVFVPADGEMLIF